MLIIAEAGVNHNGNVKEALKLIDCAKECGADIVKFQTFKADEITKKSAPLAEYQKKSSPKIDSQNSLLNKLELNENDFRQLADYCNNEDIEFLSTGFDIESLQFLVKLGIKRIKIPSGEIFNFPLLEYAASTQLPLIISTGMCTLEEINVVIDFLMKLNVAKDKITILHCTTSYPTPIEEANILAMQTIKNTFDIAVGYSDHTVDSIASQAAVALGATIIEKHFTLNNDQEGPDHKASLNPQNLSKFISYCRLTHKSLGNGIKTPTDSEKANINIARRGIYVLKDLTKGEVVKKEYLTLKRPMSNFPAKNYLDLIGKCLVTDIKSDDGINLTHVK